MKRVSTMSVAEYQALALKMERLYGAHVAWDDIPGRQVRGLPRPGTKREPLEGHLLKMTHEDWVALQRKAKPAQMSVSDFIRALACASMWHPRFPRAGSLRRLALSWTGRAWHPARWIACMRPGPG